MIVFNNKDHGRIISAAIPRRFNAEFDPVISNLRDEDNALLGGVTFDGYTGEGGCIFMHQAGFSKRWISRDMLWAAFDYPFNQLKVKKICGTIPSGNPKLLALNHRLGFKVEHSIEDGYPGGNMLVLSMTRGECPWLSIKPKGIRANR
jgi:RimJ/RimL family protein N-acetyltransferase